MRIPFVFACAFAIPACGGSNSDEVPSTGDVHVTADGTANVQARACLDAGFLACNGKDVKLTLVHDGTSTPMPYDGFLFPAHAASAPLGNPSTPFTITDGTHAVTVSLPPAFTVAGGPAAPVSRGTKFNLTWEPGTSAMRWDFDILCDNGGGGGEGGSATDRFGSVTIDTAPIFKTFDEGKLMGTCMATVKVMRVLAGEMESGFPATEGTGVWQSSVAFPIAP
jgi:hypothetical protein